MVERNQIQFPQTRSLREYEMDEELALHEPWREVVHILNYSARVVWQLCDGSRNADEIANELAAIYGLQPVVVEEDVRDILAEFCEAGLLRKPAGVVGIS